jgi:hypothetical protein
MKDAKGNWIDGEWDGNVWRPNENEIEYIHEEN